MAAYGSGYYGGGNYSYGVSLGALAVTDASTMAVVGRVVARGAFDITDASTVVVAARTVRQSNVAISSSSTATTVSNAAAIEFAASSGGNWGPVGWAGI